MLPSIFTTKSWVPKPKFHADWKSYCRYILCRRSENSWVSFGYSIHSTTRDGLHALLSATASKSVQTTISSTVMDQNYGSWYIGRFYCVYEFHPIQQQFENRSTCAWEFEFLSVSP